MDSYDKESRSSSARVPVLGKNNYDVWKMRIYAYLTVLGCVEALDENFILPPHPKVLASSTDTADAKTVELKKKVKYNNLAVAALTMAFTHPEHMEIVHSSVNNEYPQGIAKVIMKKLEQKMNPDDDIAKVEAEIELNKLQFQIKSNRCSCSKHPNQ